MNARDGAIGRFDKPLLGVGILLAALYALGAGAVDAVRRWVR